MPDPAKLTADFIHLHVHSMYSLLNAVPTPKELAKAAKADGEDALAITDAGALYGAIDFYTACTKEGIKPIIGLDAFLAPRTRFDKEVNIDRPHSRLVLLAKTFKGYQNLIKLVTKSNLEGFYYRPRLDEALLTEFKDDLICIIPSFAGEVARALKDSNPEKAAERLDWYRNTFGENCYLEITHHPEIFDHQVNQDRIKSLATKTNTPLVAAHDVYYLKPEDRLARETMIKIQNGGVVDTTAEHEGGENFSFTTQAQMKEWFIDTPEAISNTVKIAEQCTVKIEIGTTWYFPDYIIESGREPDEELRITAYEGVKWRGLNPEDKEVTTRLDYELGVIKMKGYAKYFLVVGDLLKESRKRKILTTIRGSVAGSLTTYVLGITNVNPLEYKLPFERFLNPERPSAPDIDMDYADNRRDEIIEYAKAKYGADKVAQIGTFGTMMARAAVRDVARALGHSYATGDRIAKLIPLGAQGFPMTIDRALAIEPDLAELYKKDAESREVIDLAKQIEGRVRHLGVHAAGVVIAPRPLDEFVPIQPDPKTGKFITQYEMHSVGEDGVGLLKFDFLGIKNLAILADAVKRVRKIRNIEVDIENIPLDDPKTFEILAKGETMGLFQLNGSGMTAFLKQLKPSTIHDINAMVALYRPGPMESIPQYIERKHNPALVTFLDPRMEDILDRSYGVITYQDDVMMISIKLAGYSWLEADKLRKAMGKKIPEVMAAEKDKLFQGLVKNGMTEQKADQLWKLIEPFAAYGFNKCLPASAKILDGQTGIPTTIAKLLESNRKPSVLALNHKLHLTHSKADHIFANGVKTVYELVTRGGRTIRATANHPFLTISGWIKLDSLQSGTRIAVPRQLPTPTLLGTLKKHEAATLGYLLSEGNLCHPHGVYFYSTKKDECDDFLKYAKSFANSKFTLDHSKATTSVYVGQAQKGDRNHLYRWLAELDLIGKKATAKFIPDIIFSAKNQSLAIFIGKLWQGDGAISVNNFQVFYATSSPQLARDVQHLLLRFGIISTIHLKNFRYRDGHKTGFAVTVTGHQNLERFSKHIGEHLLPNKQAKLADLLKISHTRTNRQGRGTKDTVPAEVIKIINKARKDCNLSARQVAKAAGVSERLLYSDNRKIGYSRPTLLAIANVLSSPELKNLAQSDIYWDEVVTIEKVSREMTYDLSVPEHHNFIADNFFVHNSHAASYGRVAYQTAYMKANFPVEYMSAVLTADSGDTEKISEIIHECERMGIEVLPPDINESFADFSVVPGTETIRFGLTTIKNFGAGIADIIISERKAHGAFSSIQDFLTRIHDRGLNKKSMEALVTTGAFDRFAERGQLFANIDNMLAYNREHMTGKETGQDSLFGALAEVVGLTLEPAKPTPINQKLLWEKELLGVYVSGHPLDAVAAEVAKRPRISAVKQGYQGTTVVTTGLVEVVKELLTKKGDRMAFIKIADQEDSIETVAFPETYHANRELLQPGTCVAIKGKFNLRNDEPSILIDKVKRLGDSVATEL